MKLIIKNSFIASILIVIGLIFFSCKNSINNDLKNGDLLFVTAKSTGLSGAINDVTQKSERAAFDHIGILKKEGKTQYVLHSAPKGGSQKQKLEDFMSQQKAEGQKIVVYRLKPAYQNNISKALQNAESMLGKPYNFNYILNDNSYYCSDFIERAFREFGIFMLEPMTFKDPKTGITNDFWSKFYKEKNLAVPEGELGCNPNGLAASENLIRIKEL